jgi:hypothetical protein
VPCHCLRIVRDVDDKTEAIEGLSVHNKPSLSPPGDRLRRDTDLGEVS